jgi:signal transduction histidine kinase/HAMP domain-containing protein/ActR/RegA family two-component response regulator
MHPLNQFKFIEIKHDFLHGKVAKRVFFLFVLCALIPLSALAYLSVSQVTKQLYSQAYKRLQETSKASGMLIFEHLSYLEADLEMIGSDIHKGKSDLLRSGNRKFRDSLKGRFKSLALMGRRGQFKLLFGRMRSVPSFRKDEIAHIHSGKALLLTRPTTGKFADIFMVKDLGPPGLPETFLLAEVNPEYLWSEDSLTPATELLVLDESGNMLFSSSPEYSPLREMESIIPKNSEVGQFGWIRKGNAYLAGYWTIFMRPRFYSNWVLAHSESKANIMAPISTFKTTFLLLVILTFLVVLFLSLQQIRRSLIPIQMLRDATRRVAAKDFKTQVCIGTNDEFEELGSSFNEMASSLESYLQTMTMLNRIGIAISAERNNDRLLELILIGAKDITNADGCALYILTKKEKELKLSVMRIDSINLAMNSSDGVSIPLYDKNGNADTRSIAAYSAFKGVTLNVPDIYSADGFDISGPRDFDMKMNYRSQSFLSVPLRNHENELVGVLQLTNARKRFSKQIVPFSQEDQQLLETLASQAAVALSKNQLITRLGAVNRRLRLEIAERKQAEEAKDKMQAQLLHAQKMEAIGQLAGGIAHDFNNVLTAIIGYGNLLLTNVGENSTSKAYVEHMLSASERAAELVRSLLTFSRKQITNFEPVDVNKIINGVKALLVRLIGEDVELKTFLADRDLVVTADANQIDQVLMNFATNARDAMPRGGTLTIRTELVKMDNELIEGHKFGEAREYAMIAVSDVGSGMDEDTKARIFEPFFTTKDVGKGTGLGLATTYGIVKKHNGLIRVDSELGKGTTFNIYLPLIQSEAGEKLTEVVSVMRGGTETILLVEDNAVVRGVSKEILIDSGYCVIEAADGEDALNKFLENNDKIDLLLLDVVMPKKNGKEVYEAIKKVNPDIKVIFTSGYTADIIEGKGILQEGSELIAKPFSPHVLLEKVRDMLDKQQESHSIN